MYVCMCSVDLRKFRTYQGSSVRDLLRAMRNKVCAPGGSSILGMLHCVVRYQLEVVACVCSGDDTGEVTHALIFLSACVVCGCGQDTCCLPPL